MANKSLPSEAEGNEFKDICQNKLLQDQSMHVTVLDRWDRWQSFPITLLKIVLYFLWKYRTTFGAFLYFIPKNRNFSN